MAYFCWCEINLIGELITENVIKGEWCDVGFKSLVRKLKKQKRTSYLIQNTFNPEPVWHSGNSVTNKLIN